MTDEEICARLREALDGTWLSFDDTVEEAVMNVLPVVREMLDEASSPLTP